VSNKLGNVSFQCIVVEPQSLGELVQVVARANREKQNIKAVGGFYAFSSVNAVRPESNFALLRDHVHLSDLFARQRDI
jgi:hypothetical protein